MGIGLQSYSFFMGENASYFLIQDVYIYTNVNVSKLSEVKKWLEKQSYL